MHCEGDVEELCLTEAEWSELHDVENALFGALGSKDLDADERLQILKSIQVRYSRCLVGMRERRGLGEGGPHAAEKRGGEGGR